MAERPSPGSASKKCASGDLGARLRTLFSPLNFKRLLIALIATLTVCYPFVVWFFFGDIEPRVLALVLAAFFLLRGLVGGKAFSGGGLSFWLAFASAFFLLAAAFVNRSGWLLAYPVFVSLLFFAVFTVSLFYPPTIVERLARLEDPNLPVKGVAYTRKVTLVWSVFFLINAMISTATVWYGDQWLWSLYNGLVFYLLMGLLMLGEMLVRRRVRASY